MKMGVGFGPSCACERRCCCSLTSAEHQPLLRIHSCRGHEVAPSPLAPCPHDPHDSDPPAFDPTLHAAQSDATVQATVLDAQAVHIDMKAGGQGAAPGGLRIEVPPRPRSTSPSSITPSSGQPTPTGPQPPITPSSNRPTPIGPLQNAPVGFKRPTSSNTNKDQSGLMALQVSVCVWGGDACAQ